MTVSGIFLGFVIAISGLFLLQNMIQTKGNFLLSQTGSVIAIPLKDEDGETDVVAQKTLSETELLQVLQSMESNQEEQPHEPMQGQITMEEAIEDAKIWLDNFCTQYLGEESPVFIKVSPKLCIRQKEKIIDSSSTMINSYWTVALETDEINAEIVINAVTTQVLSVSLSSSNATKDFSKLNVEQLLNDYISFSHLNKIGAIKMTGGYMYKKVTDGGIYAVIKTGSIIAMNKEGSQNGYEYENDLVLYLSTELPGK